MKTKVHLLILCKPQQYQKLKLDKEHCLQNSNTLSLKAVGLKNKQEAN